MELCPWSLNSSSPRHQGVKVHLLNFFLLFHPQSLFSVSSLTFCPVFVYLSQFLLPPSCLILPFVTFWPTLNFLGEGFFSYNSVLLPSVQITSESPAPILVIPTLLWFSQSNNNREEYSQIHGENIFFLANTKKKIVLFFQMFVIIGNLLMGVKEWLIFTSQFYLKS